MKKSTTNSRIIHVFIIVGLLFISLAAYLSWFELIGKEDIMSNSYNKRLQADEVEVIRGSIYDRTGEELAVTKDNNRLYPFKNLYSHVIGYDSKSYGKTLLEAKYNDVLLSRDTLGTLSKVENLIKGEEKVGNNISLTLDHMLQSKARELLGDRNGVIVAMNPKTGEILAMVSAPDFNPNNDILQANWDELTQDDNSPLLPRAFMGLYPPGSTFKIMTAIAAIEKGLKDTLFDDQGSISVDGKVFSNYDKKAHGNIDMTKALTVSSNVYFALLSDLLGAESLITVAEKAGISKKTDFDLSVTKSRIGTEKMGKTELAATAIGQGKLMVTPLQMVMIASGIANDGVIMKPFLLGNISSSNDTILSTTKPQKLYTLTDVFTAQAVKDMMIEVVNSGTGTEAQISGTVVAGKTGTAQNEKSSQGDGYDHAWFIGFAPAYDPEIAVAVILEYQSQGGGKAAAPIARKIMEMWLNNK